jgi:hypothetical protein
VLAEPGALLGELLQTGLVDGAQLRGVGHRVQMTDRRPDPGDAVGGRFQGRDHVVEREVAGGVPSALVSLPLRCMHSVVETAHLDDIENTIRLLTDFVLALTAEDTFHQSL